MQEFKMIHYKCYRGIVTYDSRLKVFHGDVIGLRHVITFEGANPEEIEQSFKEAIDDYLAMCKEEGIKPEKVFSGKFMVRISPKLHATLFNEAIKAKTSLNAYITSVLSSRSR
jgi:predicted HicB family RNase H-like nuclease